ncbi:DUF3311 domain-containing protein [Halopiger xanaduensis]|uniref:DUF3311 domain-containing protein n=1 Tax=Halopiger xanaduensis (strain DSM 18323 / JCM 14033 / SH-6) TaxID=797210 RepID=F8D897_HALXS|nr:DUF3311 domain-containing protein [Halopiger xanaduensis]AEH36738.1 hypothetical protein Halxa_2113 [Halopiger xanaduensis SH-6]
MRRLELGGWIAVGVVLCALSIPWFLWGNDATVAGVPLWLWWHVGWMGLASLVFRYFAQRAWGLGIEPRYGERDAEPNDAGAQSRGDAP